MSMHVSGMNGERCGVGQALVWYTVVVCPPVVMMSVTCPNPGWLLFALTAVVPAAANELCEMPAPPPGVPVPLADGFVAPGAALPGGGDRAYSVEQVLYRRRLEQCRQAIAAALTPVAAPTYTDDYIKQTEFDNTPYRFNMTQNGKRMSADDFDAWLQANGYSVGRRVEPGAAQAQDD